MQLYLTYFPLFAMKRFLFSSLSFVLGLSIITPGFAYFSVPGNAESSYAVRQTRRHIVNRAEATNKLPEFIPQEDRNRGEAVQQATTGYLLMRGSEGRRLRRYNRTRKPGFDRYRTLNLRTNRRSLRGMEYESSLDLPRTLVQTGGYDRPTRRDIRDNALFNDVYSRNRNILNEISESAR